MQVYDPLAALFNLALTSSFSLDNAYLFFTNHDKFFNLPEKDRHVNLFKLSRLFLIFLSLCIWGCASPPVESYMDYEPRKNKLIILTTGMLDAWKPDTEGVDATTSASALNKSDKIAKIIVNKILAIIEQNKAQ